jgi:hypothetical protein
VLKHALQPSGPATNPGEAGPVLQVVYGKPRFWTEEAAVAMKEFLDMCFVPAVLVALATLIMLGVKYGVL